LQVEVTDVDSHVGGKELEEDLVVAVHPKLVHLFENEKLCVQRQVLIRPIADDLGKFKKSRVFENFKLLAYLFKTEFSLVVRYLHHRVFLKRLAACTKNI